MCNLYKLRRTAEEVAQLFRVDASAGANVAAELYPGYPGLVVAEGRARAMTWGYPLILKGRDGRQLKPKAVTNARDDKLTTPFWRDSFARRRCLIPVSQWAEAEGETGRMTRTWYGLPGADPFAVAGLWRPTAEWGDAYAMVMADSCAAMAEVHDRMPVILRPDQWAQWQDGPPEAALALAHPWPGELAVERTRERWAGVSNVPEQPGLV